MSLQYDSIGKNYNSVKDLPLQALAKRVCYRLLGDLTGLNVLDLACGTGNDSRQFIAMGAFHVTGIDISPTMIDAARDGLRSDVRDMISYHVSDCATPDMFHTLGLANHLGTYDVVFGGYLLNYAPSAETLKAMFANIVLALRPGGRFVGLTINSPLIAQFGPDKPFEDNGMSSTWEVIGVVENGYKVVATVDVIPEVQIECFWLRSELYAAAAEEAGLVGMEWTPVLSDESAIKEHGKDFWVQNDGRPRYAVYTGVKLG
ncbi:S-adenosyl-L-methionine-dependent methyltransferase [Mycena rebaudengoi]|nr:S-adenosyl-L-methionine-dependent methyltransferase [Mycena rebaudengoi]